LALDSAERSFNLLHKRRQTMRGVLARLALRTRNAEDLQDLARLIELLDADDEEFARLEQDMKTILKGSSEGL
jgi:hypothetical protein